MPPPAMREEPVGSTVHRDGVVTTKLWWDHGARCGCGGGRAVAVLDLRVSEKEGDNDLKKQEEITTE